MAGTLHPVCNPLVNSDPVRGGNKEKEQYPKLIPNYPDLLLVAADESRTLLKEGNKFVEKIVSFAPAGEGVRIIFNTAQQVR